MGSIIAPLSSQALAGERVDDHQREERDADGEKDDVGHVPPLSNSTPRFCRAEA